MENPKKRGKLCVLCVCGGLNLIQYRVSPFCMVSPHPIMKLMIVSIIVLILCSLLRCLGLGNADYILSRVAAKRLQVFQAELQLPTPNTMEDVYNPTSNPTLSTSASVDKLALALQEGEDGL